MIVVTGSCRAGTSLMMQTLKLLGIEIAGEKFHADFPVEEGNPKGYYDLPFEIVMNGLGEEYKGKGVKILGEWLLNTDPDLISHMIICKRRDAGAQDRSTKKLLKLDSETESDSEIRKELLKSCWPMSDEMIAERREGNYRIIDYCQKRIKGFTKEVYFEDMIYQPLKTINEIKEFLFQFVPDADVKEAVENVGI
jgi:hypothetical protein